MRNERRFSSISFLWSRFIPLAVVIGASFIAGCGPSEKATDAPTTGATAPGQPVHNASQQQEIQKQATDDKK